MDGSGASEAFVSQVHSALQHLYDPVYLRRSPLLALLDLDTYRSPVSALGRILIDAIQILKPAEDVPYDSGAWRIYRLLTHRFLEHTPQKQVAVDLGFSIRQMRRQELAAVRSLADYLWNRHGLALKTPELLAAAQQTEAQEALAETETPDREHELEWLKGSFPNETADLTEVIGTALRNAAPLLAGAGLRVECRIPDNRPPVSGQLSILRLALLNLFTAAACSVAGGILRVAVSAHDQTACMEVQIQIEEGVSRSSFGKRAEYLGTARQLIQLFGGQVEAVVGQGREPGFAATVIVSAVEQVPVLVVDDNSDTLRLLQRFLSGTRYRFTGTPNPEDAVALAADLRPRVIMLDIMLPGVDGLELLSRLREHPKTRDIPVVICSILPQEEIVMTLGAAGFVRKPVSRGALLSVLDQQMASPPPKSR